MLSACVDCSRPVPQEATRFHFSSLAGGILCSRCRSGKTNIISVSREALDWMRARLEQDPGEELPSGQLSPRARVEIRQVLNHFENSLTGFRLPVQELLS